MDEKAVKRRNWVKNILIIFLAVMLVLTLFSNTIMNYSLPQVAAQYCGSGTITTRIRGSGNVEAKEVYSVTAPTSMASAKIKAVGVKVGTPVTADTVLFTLEDTQQQDIIEATQKLAALKEEYNTILKESGINDTDLLSQITKKQEEIARLQFSYYEGTAAEAELKAMDIEKGNAEKQNGKNTDRLAEVKVSITAIETALKSSDDLALSLSAAEADFIEKTTALENAKTNQSAAEENAELAAEAQEKANEKLEEIKSSGVGETITLDELNTLRKNYEQSKLDYQKAEIAYNNLNAELDSIGVQRDAAFAEAGEAWRIYIETPSDNSDSVAVYNASDNNEDTTAVENDEPIITPPVINTNKKEEALAYFQKCQSNYEALVEEYETKQKTLTAAWYDLQSNQVNLRYEKENLDRKEQLYKNSGSNELKKYEDAVKTAEKNVKEANKALDNAKNALTLAQSQYDSAKEMLSILKNSDSESYDALISEHDTLEKAIEDYTYGYEKSYSDFQIKYNELTAVFNSASKKSDVDAAKDALIELQNQLKSATTVDENASEVSSLKLEAKSQEIDKQEELIEKIKTGDYTLDIYAPVEGIISEINVIAGNEVALNSTLAEIQIVDRGFMTSFKVTTDQAKRIAVGTAAEVSYWWGSDISATVASVTPDPDSPNTSRIVKLDVVGDVSVGTNLSFSIGEKSQSYESVIPNTAIREDNNGKFVLVVIAKATPLSTRYTAQRMDVEVIASDDTSTAVSGISYGDYVITTSSKPVTSGMQVRLNENG